MLNFDKTFSKLLQ